jgi:hypothetical protein
MFFETNAQNDRRPTKNKKDRPSDYSIEQAVSDQAQLHTVAFNGLAFITGNFGTDTFFPPGKVADFFGFQYMRDIDKNKMGHNTDFLTRVADNVISVLTPEQLQQLKNLGEKQAPIYNEFARKRIVLIRAFRDRLEGNFPAGKSELSKDSVIKFGSELYESDAELSYERAVTVGKIIASFTDSQKKYLEKMKFDNSSTCPDLPENLDKRSLSHRAHVAVMTYASELFSWYAGSETADVYFCPERHGTYFGGFFLKDYRAVGNHGYNISTSLTGDKGEDFINTLLPAQSASLNRLIEIQKPLLTEIIEIRRNISKELRKAMKNETPDKEKVFKLIHRYGEIDGELSFEETICFADIYKNLSPEQKKKLVKIRDLKDIPKGAYLFSDPIEMPENIDTDFLFK